MAGELDPLDRGESAPLVRFLLALDRGDSLPLRRGESLPRRRGESLLRLLGDPEDLLNQRICHNLRRARGSSRNVKVRDTRVLSRTDLEWAESAPRRWWRRGESTPFRYGEPPPRSRSTLAFCSSCESEPVLEPFRTCADLQRRQPLTCSRISSRSS